MFVNSTTTIQIKKNESFKKLHQIVFKELLNQKKCLLNYKLINKKIKKVGPRDLRKNNKLMIKVESLILNILKDLKIKKIQSLQYPVNIRISSNNNFPSKFRDYDTRHVHCDSWSGAPKDSYNAFIYLFACEKAPKLELYQNLPKKHKYRNFLGKYSGLKVEKKYLKKVKFNAEPGNMAIWETYTPHKTKVIKNLNKNYYRISIDFRFKKSSPYPNKKNYNAENFYKSKMNNDGVYWFVKKNYSSFSNLKNKIKYELGKVKRKGIDYNLRKEYVRKFYSNKLINEVI